MPQKGIETSRIPNTCRQAMMHGATGPSSARSTVRSIRSTLIFGKPTVSPPRVTRTERALFIDLQRCRRLVPVTIAYGTGPIRIVISRRFEQRRASGASAQLLSAICGRIAQRASTGRHNVAPRHRRGDIYDALRTSMASARGQPLGKIQKFAHWSSPRSPDYRRRRRAACPRAVPSLA